MADEDIIGAALSGIGAGVNSGLDQGYANRARARTQLIGVLQNTGRNALALASAKKKGEGAERFAKGIDVVDQVNSDIKSKEMLITDLLDPAKALQYAKQRGLSPEQAAAALKQDSSAIAQLRDLGKKAALLRENSDQLPMGESGVVKGLLSDEVNRPIVIDPNSKDPKYHSYAEYIRGREAEIDSLARAWSKKGFSPAGVASLRDGLRLGIRWAVLTSLPESAPAQATPELDQAGFRKAGAALGERLKGLSVEQVLNDPRLRALAIQAAEKAYVGSTIAQAGTKLGIKGLSDFGVEGEASQIAFAALRGAGLPETAGERGAAANFARQVAGDISGRASGIQSEAQRQEREALLARALPGEDGVPQLPTALASSPQAPSLTLPPVAPGGNVPLSPGTPAPPNIDLAALGGQVRTQIASQVRGVKNVGQAISAGVQVSIPFMKQAFASGLSVEDVVAETLPPVIQGLREAGVKVPSVSAVEQELRNNLPAPTPLGVGPVSSLPETGAPPPEGEGILQIAEALGAASEGQQGGLGVPPIGLPGAEPTTLGMALPGATGALGAPQAPSMMIPTTSPELAQMRTRAESQLPPAFAPAVHPETQAISKQLIRGEPISVAQNRIIDNLLESVLDDIDRASLAEQLGVSSGGSSALTLPA